MSFNNRVNPLSLKDSGITFCPSGQFVLRMLLPAMSARDSSEHFGRVQYGQTPSPWLAKLPTRTVHEQSQLPFSVSPGPSRHLRHSLPLLDSHATSLATCLATSLATSLAVRTRQSQQSMSHMDSIACDCVCGTVPPSDVHLGQPAPPPPPVLPGQCTSRL